MNTIRCPYCGSEKTARILWGMPALSEKLERDLEAGTVILGGCMVSGNDPSYECRECGKQFGRPPVLKVRGEEGRIRKILPEMITGIEYSIGGFFDGCTFVKVVKEGSRSAICVIHPYVSIREFSAAEWKRLLDKMFKRLFVHEWKQDYMNRYILDGTQWSLEFRDEEKNVYRISGSNAFPPLFDTLNRMFHYYVRKDNHVVIDRMEKEKLAYMFRNDGFVTRRIEEMDWLGK